MPHDSQDGYNDIYKINNIKFAYSKKNYQKQGLANHIEKFIQQMTKFFCNFWQKFEGSPIVFLYTFCPYLTKIYYTFLKSA
jgi:hypothetical protein